MKSRPAKENQDNLPDDEPRQPTSILVVVGVCGLHKRTPYGITNVSMTQFSIARHFGGIKYNGDDYTYFPHTDELIRDDVLRWKNRR